MADNATTGASAADERSVELITGVCRTPGAEGAPVFGVCVRRAGGVYRFEDVDSDRGRVERLICRLREAAVEPCHLAEVIADEIERMAGEPDDVAGGCEKTACVWGSDMVK